MFMHVHKIVIVQLCKYLRS